jgi:hypothetical protein
MAEATALKKKEKEEAKVAREEANKSEAGEGFRTCCSQSAKKSRTSSCKSPKRD